MPAPECTCRVEVKVIDPGEHGIRYPKVTHVIEKCDLCKSAPKLYEACEEIRQLFEMIYSPDDNSDSDLRAALVEKLCVAALAEARGTK